MVSVVAVVPVVVAELVTVLVAVLVTVESPQLANRPLASSVTRSLRCPAVASHAPVLVAKSAPETSHETLTMCSGAPVLILSGKLGRSYATMLTIPGRIDVANVWHVSKSRACSTENEPLSVTVSRQLNSEAFEKVLGEQLRISSSRACACSVQSNAVGTPRTGRPLNVSQITRPCIVVVAEVVAVDDALLVPVVEPVLVAVDDADDDRVDVAVLVTVVCSQFPSAPATNRSEMALTTGASSEQFCKESTTPVGSQLNCPGNRDARGNCVCSDTRLLSTLVKFAQSAADRIRCTSPC